MAAHMVESKNFLFYSDIDDFVSHLTYEMSSISPPSRRVRTWSPPPHVADRTGFDTSCGADGCLHLPCWTIPWLQGRLISWAYAIPWRAMEIAQPLIFMKPEPDGIVNQFFGEF